MSLDSKITAISYPQAPPADFTWEHAPAAWQQYASETIAFEEYFQPGDIVFFKLDPSRFRKRDALNPDDRIDVAILEGQSMARRFSRSDHEEESHSFIHVGIIAQMQDGEKYLVEATPGDHGDDVRAVKLTDPMLRLGRDSRQEYQVVRLRNPEIAAGAAKIASDLAEIRSYNEKEEPVGVDDPATPYRYSKSNATLSLVKFNRLGGHAKRRIFKSFVQLYYGGELRHRSERMKFFCSNLVGFCLQMAEMGPIIRAILEQDKRIIVPSKKRYSSQQELDYRIQQWAGAMNDRFGHRLEEGTFMHFHSTGLSPQRLRAHIRQNSGEFETVLRVLGPQSPAPEAAA